MVFVETPSRDWNTRYSIVTDFGEDTLRMRYVPGLETLEDGRKWVVDNLETAKFEGVEIRRLPVTSKSGETGYLYWVGHKAFESANEAKAEIAMIKDAIEAKGGNFKSMVSQAEAAHVLPEEEPPVEIKTEAQYRKEEELALKFLDYMNIGEKLYGPFHGTPMGEPILWQSFGEASWRQTNLESKNNSNVTGYWANRIVFKGIRAPLNTVDPYVEVTNSLDSSGVDYKSNMQLWAGLEWRPLARMAWFQNFRPFGDFAILNWIRNYRLFVQYGNRKNLKDEIEASDNHDLKWGAQIYFEWGTDLPSLDEAAPGTFSEYIRRYVWGEYFGSYVVNTTGFSSEDDYDAVTLNSSVILGFKTPPLPLPSNPINDELVLMPYLRFEHTSNDEFSFPASNQYFVGAGLRWMPFNNYRYKENEWLYKTRLFAEYVGIGKVQHTKQDGEAPDAVRYDLRFGVSFSSNRF